MPTSPSGQGLFIVTNTNQVLDPINGNTWAFIAGPPGELWVYQNNVWNLVVGLGAPYILSTQTSGVPTASAIMLVHKFPVAVVFPASLTNSQGGASTPATAQTNFDIQKNGASIGTMRFAASASIPSFIFASNVSFAVGDTMKIIAPGSPDASLAGVFLSLLGTR